MKKVVFSLAILAATAVMASCGNKAASGESAENSESEQITALEGETVDTRFYTIIIPQGWKVKDMSTKDYNLYLKPLKEDGTEGSGYIRISANEFRTSDKFHEPNERLEEFLSANKERVNKGEMKFGRNTFFVGENPSFKTFEMYTKLADNGLMNISVATLGIDDAMVKAIIDNIVIKETAGPKAEPKVEEISYKTEPGKKGFTRYFLDKGVSVELPDGVAPRKGAKNIFDEQDQKYATVYSVTITTLSDHFNQDEYMKSRTESMQKMRKDTKVTKNGKNFDMTYTQNTTITAVEHHVTTPEKAVVVRIMYWNTNREDHPEKYVKDVFSSVKMD